MRNVLHEAPSRELHGRLLYTTRFVRDSDVRGKSVLEIGCGYGWFAIAALQRGVGRYVGIEPTPPDLETARAHVVAPEAEFRIGSALDIPLPDASVDSVFCWEVIEHLPSGSEPAMFREVRRVLRGGGGFYLSTPFRSLRGMAMDPLFLPIHHRHYDERDLLRLGGEVGMELTAFAVVGRWWETAASWNLHFSKWVLRRGLVFEKFFGAKADEEFASGRGWACLFGRLEAS